MKSRSLCRGILVPEGAEGHLVAFQKFISTLEGEKRNIPILGIESEETDPPRGLGKPHQAPLYV